MWPGEDAAYVWHSLGTLRLNQRRYAEAIETFKSGLRRNAASSQASRSPAISRRDLGDISAISWACLGEISGISRKDLGRYLGHISARSRAYLGEISAVSPQLLLGVALCHLRVGDADAARDYFGQSTRADVRHAHAWQVCVRECCCCGLAGMSPTCMLLLGGRRCRVRSRVMSL